MAVIEAETETGAPRLTTIGSPGKSWVPRRLGGTGLAVFSLLALAPAVLGALLPEFSRQEMLASLAYSLALWSFWLALWGNPWRGCVAASPLLLFAPIAIYLLLAFHAPLSPAAFGVIFETNPQEASEFVGGSWSLIAFAYAALFAIATAALIAMQRDPVAWATRWRVAILLGVPAIFLVLHLTYRPLEVAAATLHNMPNVYRNTIWPLEVENVRLSWPFGVVLQLSDAIESQRRLARMSEAIRSFRFGAKQGVDFPDRQVYVLVIGESSRQDRWGLYGYGRPTTPRLGRETGLVPFRDVVTVAPATRASVPVILTRKPPAMGVPDFNERSIVSAFKEAGFATYWLSTQAPFGYFDVTYSAYAREAGHTHYYNMKESWQHAPLDGVMLEPLRRILANASERRQFIVIHTLGSHIEYRVRYPDAFDVFKPSLPRDDATVLHDADYIARLNNTYDNSILYTDYFLSEVLDAIKGSGRPLATLLYVSDHGEDLYDGGCALTGHGKPTTAGIRVPMLFWRSSAYDRVFPGKIAMLKAHSGERLTTEAVFPLLADAADLHFPSEVASRSVLSESFVPQLQRMVYPLTGSLDFDRAHSNAECLLVD